MIARCEKERRDRGVTEKATEQNSKQVIEQNSKQN